MTPASLVTPARLARLPCTSNDLAIHARQGLANSVDSSCQNHCHAIHGHGCRASASATPSMFSCQPGAGLAWPGRSAQSTAQTIALLICTQWTLQGTFTCSSWWCWYTVCGATPSGWAATATDPTAGGVCPQHWQQQRTSNIGTAAQGQNRPQETIWQPCLPGVGTAAGVDSPATGAAT